MAAPPPPEVASRIATWEPIVVEEAAEQDVEHLIGAFDSRTSDLP